MKVAICFYGLVGSKLGKNGKGAPLPPALAHAYYRKHIFAHQDCDIFIHSWSTEHKQTLLALYGPTATIIEPRRNFPPLPKHLAQIPLKNRVQNLFLKLINKKDQKVSGIENSYSRWYSNQKTLSLARQHEERTGLVYDYIMVTRLDVVFFRDLFFETYDPTLFWASHWNDPPYAGNNFTHNYKNHNVGKGFLDFWFFSNSENMHKFSALYDKRSFYYHNPHIASFEHVQSFTNKINYTFYRWQDHEMIRRKLFKSKR